MDPLNLGLVIVLIAGITIYWRWRGGRDTYREPTRRPKVTPGDGRPDYTAANGVWSWGSLTDTWGFGIALILVFLARLGIGRRRKS